jgi:hypothetical protein
MRIDRFVCVVCLCVLSSAATAAAQEAGRVGLVMGLPGSIGAIWYASERVAIRPELTFSQASGETKPQSPLPFESSTVTNDSWSIGVAVSGLLYMKTAGSLRMYVSPRYSYARSSSTTDASSPVSIDFEGRGSSHQVSGSFGAFGEMGLAYSRSRTTTSSAFSRIVLTANGVGTRGGVGVFLLF